MSGRQRWWLLVLCNTHGKLALSGIILGNKLYVCSDVGMALATLLVLRLRSKLQVFWQVIFEANKNPAKGRVSNTIILLFEC